MPMEYKLHIGCHLSSAKGFLAMGREASRLGADTFAFFTRNPRGGRAKELDLADVEAFLQYKEEAAKSAEERRQSEEKYHKLEEKCSEFENSYFDLQMENVRLKNELEKLQRNT